VIPGFVDFGCVSELQGKVYPVGNVMAQKLEWVSDGRIVADSKHG
jgi:hypothetical protein